MKTTPATDKIKKKFSSSLAKERTLARKLLAWAFS